MRERLDRVFGCRLLEYGAALAQAIELQQDHRETVAAQRERPPGLEEHGRVQPIGKSGLEVR